MFAILLSITLFQSPDLSRFGVNGDLTPTFLYDKLPSSWFHSQVINDDSKQVNYYAELDGVYLKDVKEISFQNYEDNAKDVVVSLVRESEGKPVYSNYLIRLQPFELMKIKISADAFGSESKLMFASLGEFGIQVPEEKISLRTRVPRRVNGDCFITYNETRSYCYECDRQITVKNSKTNESVIALLRRWKGPTFNSGCDTSFQKFFRIHIYYPLNYQDPYNNLFHFGSRKAGMFVCGLPSCKMEAYPTEQVSTGRDLTWRAISAYDSFDDVIFKGETGIARCPDYTHAVCGSDRELFFYIY